MPATPETSNGMIEVKVNAFSIGTAVNFLRDKGQIPLHYPASEPARELVRELVCDLLASWSQTC